MGLKILTILSLHGETPTVVNGTEYSSDLSGEIRPSLMKLKSLQSLDLSFNTFKDIPISKFFGSLVKEEEEDEESELKEDNWMLNSIWYKQMQCTEKRIKTYDLIPVLGGNTNGQMLNTSDHEALMDFKNGLEDSHNRLATWRNTNCCQWHGVYCDNITGAVVAIDLRNPHPELFDSSPMWNLSGMVTEDHFSKLSKLKILLMSENSFTFNVSVNWIPPFQLQSLDMGSCALGPSFPTWLKSQSKIQEIDFSNARLVGFIPNWFWDISTHMTYINISHNELQGRLPNPIPTAFDPSVTLDLSFNLLEGLVPVTTSGFNLLDLSHNRFSGAIPLNISQDMNNLQILSLSDNQLHGEIPLSLGEMSRVTVIVLSRNNLTGRIPPSLANCSVLEVLDLGNNNLFGTVPGSLGMLKYLKSLHLNDNHFSGDLPSSLRNLSSLETMDLGYNILSGIIPTWFGEGFPFLRILVLRSNAFSGELSLEFSELGSLQVLDLARNDLTGSIPVNLGDLKAIAQVHRKNKYLFYGYYYEESIEVYMKDQMLKYTKTLSLVTSIDLSDNNFTGNIPNEITKLFGMVVLNLSRNHITGQIPGTMSNLLQLSSLDLSNNRLSGTIPSSLSSLSFLGFLDLSNNNLMGVIPYTGHMTTFDAIAFTGNPGLCGPPLPVKCLGDDDNKQSNNDTSEEGLFDNWFYLSLGLGFATGILVPYFILTMKSSWGDVYFDFVDQVIHKLLKFTGRQGINHDQRRRVLTGSN
ncbi:hypothetical protein TSUD_268520 [Trifolium subterraneum]|uniref:Leucine-rich repeat-containing N-terminal plant-type domain-containing protein n=1 Tax=Trifolium subterraneum TaxID=3900 RepID=A0A2Z6NRS9_TRISU|nr:hypothetical protein TSUD_268520 [Trifolium subterraneum]